MADMFWDIPPTRQSKRSPGRQAGVENDAGEKFCGFRFRVSQRAWTAWENLPTDNSSYSMSRFCIVLCVLICEIMCFSSWAASSSGKGGGECP